MTEKNFVVVKLMLFAIYSAVNIELNKILKLNNLAKSLYIYVVVNLIHSDCIRRIKTF